jgi:hypothetical protein
MCLFSVDFIRSAANGSPDRVDALVWGLTKIFDKLTGRRLTAETGPTKQQIEDGQQIDWVRDTATGWMAG